MSTYERHVLGNGLRVVALVATAIGDLLPDVRGRLALRDSGETNGIAHFTEHMFFKGTERWPTAGTSPARSMRSAASSVAFTGKEYTGYYVKCASPQIDTALDVLVDMIRNSKFEPEEIEREKGVILEELNMYLDTPRWTWSTTSTSSCCTATSRWAGS